MVKRLPGAFLKSEVCVRRGRGSNQVEARTSSRERDTHLDPLEDITLQVRGELTVLHFFA